MVKKLPALQATQFRFLGQKDLLEEGMATHSSILAWRIPWTEEPARLLSVGLQRVRHDRACMHRIFMGFPGGSVVKNLPDNAGDLGSVPES